MMQKIVDQSKDVSPERTQENKSPEDEGETPRRSRKSFSRQQARTNVLGERRRELKKILEAGADAQGQVDLAQLSMEKAFQQLADHHGVGKNPQRRGHAAPLRTEVIDRPRVTPLVTQAVDDYLQDLQERYGNDQQRKEKILTQSLERAEEIIENLDEDDTPFLRETIDRANILRATLEQLALQRQQVEDDFFSFGDERRAFDAVKDTLARAGIQSGFENITFDQFLHASTEKPKLPAGSWRQKASFLLGRVTGATDMRSPRQKLEEQYAYAKSLAEKVVLDPEATAARRRSAISNQEYRYNPAAATAGAGDARYELRSAASNSEDQEEVDVQDETSQELQEQEEMAKQEQEFFDASEKQYQTERRNFEAVKDTLARAGLVSGLETTSFDDYLALITPRPAAEGNWRDKASAWLRRTAGVDTRSVRQRFVEERYAEAKELARQIVLDPEAGAQRRRAAIGNQESRYNPVGSADARYERRSAAANVEDQEEVNVENATEQNQDNNDDDRSLPKAA